MNLISIFSKVYWRYFASPERYARHLGVTIGDDCLISTRVWPTEPYLVTIGNHVQITQGVIIHTHGGAHVARRLEPGFDFFGKVVIEDWVYIGAGSQIMPGVTIGQGSLIAAGSIVTKSVPPGSVVGGNPAHFICSVDQFIKKNKNYNRGTYSLSPSKKKDFLLSLSDDMFITK